MMTRASEMGHGTARSYPSSRGAQLLPGHLPSASAAHLVSCLSSLLVSRVSAPNLRLPPQLLPAPSAGHPTCFTRKTGAGGRNDARNTRHPIHRTAALPAASSLWTFLSQLLGTFSRFILSLALSVDSSHQHLTYSFSLVLRNKIKTLLSPTPAGLRPGPHRTGSPRSLSRLTSWALGAVAPFGL